MHHRSRLAGALCAVLALFSLAACASAPSLDPAQMTAVREGRQSAIIMSYLEFQGMYGATVTFVNTATGQPYSVRMHGGDNWVNAGPDMVAVPPGRYRVQDGGMYTADSSGTMPLLAYWFDDFEVAPGEVIDVGALHVRAVDVRALPGARTQLMNRLLLMGPANTDTYLAYSVDYADEARVQHMLETKYPDLGVAPVRRPLQPLLDQTRFEQTVVEAYAPNADGSLPTVEQANARVGDALRRLLAESRARPSARP